MLRNLINDECGAIISAEITLVLTIAVLAMVVGLSEVAVAANTELNDISNALGAMNQSFFFTGFHATTPTKTKSVVPGSQFTDHEDVCDKNESCEIVCGTTGVVDCGESNNP